MGPNVILQSATLSANSAGTDEVFGLLLLNKEVKSTIKDYWKGFKEEHPEIKIPEKV